MCGEASTCYTRWPHYGDVAERLHAAVPEAKLIYIMRHPVERAYSHYAHNMRHEITMTFGEALATDESIIDASLYMKQIEQYLRFYPREQMCFLTVDDLRQNPAQCLETCQQFLGLEHHDLLSEGEVTANQAGESWAYQTFLGKLRRIRRLPGVSHVADLVGPQRRQQLLWFVHGRLMRSSLANRMAQRHRESLKPMTPATRQRLLERFEPDTAQLEQFLDRKLTGWFE